MLAVLQNNPRRTAAYAAAFVILAAAYAARFNTFATAGEAVYALTVVMVVTVALVAGELALQRFRTEQRDALLLVSAGLWVAAALHLYHYAAYAGVFGPNDSLLAAASVLRGQLIPTLFFSLFLLLSLLASGQSRPSTAQPGGVFLAAATLAFIVTIGALVFPLPQAGDLVEILGQPIPPLAAQPELLLVTALTVIGIAELLRRDTWRTEAFARWLLVALLVTLAALARFPLLNAWPSEALLLLAQGLTLASYACAIAGIVAGVRARPAVSESVEDAQRPAAADAASPASAATEQPTRSPALALRDLQARHRALRNATDGLLVGVRDDGTITDWKPAADFGPTATPSELMGKNIKAVLPSDQAEAILRAVGHVFASGKTERLHYAAADGSLVLAGYVTPHSADQALCIMRDHTALARARQELDEQRSAAESLRRVTGDWLIRMTRAGIIQDLQPPAAAEMDSFAEMFAGKHLEEVFQGDDVAPLVAAAETALANQELQELSFLRQSGQVLAVRVTTYADDSVLCLLRDVTELKEAAAQLAESEETNQELRAHLERLHTEHTAALTHVKATVRVLHTLLPDLLLRVRADGTILECKPAEGFGPNDADSVVDARVREVLPVDLASQIMAAIERVQGSEQPQRFVCHPTGGQALAGGVAALVDDQYLCVVRDQTHQKQMESALAQQAAALAKEMQARLEEESLRILRNENDNLRAQLLRVAHVALETGTGTEPAEAGHDAAGTTGQGPETMPKQPGTGRQAPTSESGQAGTPPATAPQRPGKSSLPPPPSALQAASKSIPAADPVRDAATQANGETRLHGAEAGPGETPRNSADAPATETTAQAETAVAAQTETRPKPDIVANGQAIKHAMANGQPREEKRPSKTGQ